MQSSPNLKVLNVNNEKLRIITLKIEKKPLPQETDFLNLKVKIPIYVFVRNLRLHHDPDPNQIFTQFWIRKKWKRIRNTGKNGSYSKLGLIQPFQCLVLRTHSNLLRFFARMVHRCKNHGKQIHLDTGAMPRIQFF